MSTLNPSFGSYYRGLQGSYFTFLSLGFLMHKQGIHKCLESCFEGLIRMHVKCFAHSWRVTISIIMSHWGVWVQFSFFLFLLKEREREICCSTVLCIHWLFLVCALTRDWMCNFGLSGWCSNHPTELSIQGWIKFLSNPFSKGLIRTIGYCGWGTSFRLVLVWFFFFEVFFSVSYVCILIAPSLHYFLADVLMFHLSSSWHLPLRLFVINPAFTSNSICDSLSRPDAGFPLPWHQSRVCSCSAPENKVGEITLPPECMRSVGFLKTEVLFSPCT